MSGTVTVASKLPFPLRLQCQEPTTITEEIPGFGRKERTRWNPVGKVIVINGCSVDHAKPSEKILAGGAALTHGVDADFWAKWEAWALENFEPYQSGKIFAQEKPAAAVAEAKERSNEKSGFEPVDPANLPDEFKAAVEKAA